MTAKQRQLYGVIGYPIGHSLSPILHQFFFDYFAINGVYLAFQVQPERLAGVIDGMRAFDLAGLNVTTPFKEIIPARADRRSAEVELLGAANTLAHERDSGKITAFSTDHLGFVASLGQHKDRFSQARVVLLGAGGSAKSIAYALVQLAVAKITIVNRTRERAQDLARLMQTLLHFSAVTVMTPDDLALNDTIAAADVVINTTTTGMYPKVGTSILPDFSAFCRRHFVYDLIYNPQNTFFLAQAGAMGAQTQSGLDMLIYQGLFSQSIWQNRTLELPPAAMEQIRQILIGNMPRNE